MYIFQFIAFNPVYFNLFLLIPKKFATLSQILIDKIDSWYFDLSEAIIIYTICNYPSENGFTLCMKMVVLNCSMNEDVLTTQYLHFGPNGILYIKTYVKVCTISLQHWFNMVDVLNDFYDHSHHVWYHYCIMEKKGCDIDDQVLSWILWID